MKIHNVISIIPLLLFFLLSSCAVGVREEITEPKAKGEEEQLKEIMNVISSDTLLNHVKNLSSERYAGRLSGTPEYKSCAQWLASYFKKLGLKPAGDENTYLQSYPNPYTVVFVGGELSYSYQSRGRWRKRKYVYEKEYYPGSQSGDGKIIAEVVYVGYGITAPEMNYDDYIGVNVKNKIVLVDPEVPVSPDENPELFKDWMPYSSLQYKAKMAMAHGARGMLINRLTVNPNTEYIPGFIVAQVGEVVIKDIFAGTGKTNKEVQEKIKHDLKPQSFRTRKTFTIENFTEHNRKGTGYNVISLLEGSDPLLSEEVIILGAHLDHVGFCYEIMPGANDNASGVAALMGVAEALSRTPIKPKRSVMFIGLGSNEQAFKGSKAYLENPVFAKEKTVLYINLDMVGCGKVIQALGAQNYPELWNIISKANNKSVELTIESLPYTNLGLPQQDTDIFLGKSIPSISFRAYGTITHPHTTKDTVKTITPGIMEGLAKLLYPAILDLANTDQVLIYRTP